MPHRKHVRLGEGWFDVNLNSFYDYLDSRGEEIIVRNFTKFYTREGLDLHDKMLSEEIEKRVNQFISVKVFHKTQESSDQDDLTPNDIDSVWMYAYHYVRKIVDREPEWYLLRLVPR